jgi:hypothetical protein
LKVENKKGIHTVRKHFGFKEDCSFPRDIQLFVDILYDKKNEENKKRYFLQ